jgi:dTDP-4-amino-4,6-dideoxygalactose transaminase
MIYYGKQSIGNEEVKIVKNVLRGKYLTQGPYVKIFEDRLGKFFGSKYCVTFSSGTSALYSLGKALGWNKKDYIITTPISFLATSNCIEFCGANTEFVDVDPNFPTINLDKVKKKFFELKKKNKKVVAIIAVDYAGVPCDWKGLRKFASENKLKLINDNCHAMGTKYYNDRKYAIKYADFVSQSFHPVKSITTGEGGAIITNNKRINNLLKLHRNHCIIKDKKKIWNYNINEIGHNYRITDLQCAIGIEQIKKVDNFIKKRREVANLYYKHLSKFDILQLPPINKNFSSAYHLFPIRIKKLKESTKIKLFKMFEKNGFQLQVHYKPIILQNYYKKKYNIDIKNFKNSIFYYKDSFSAPIYPNIKKREILNFIKLMKKFLKKR